MNIRQSRQIFRDATERQLDFYRHCGGMTTPRYRAHDRLFRATVRAQVRLYRALEQFSGL